MLMISLTIFFHPDMTRFMVEQLKKLQWLQKFVWRVLGQLFSELWAYYASLKVRDAHQFAKIWLI
jgi:hypothetical protein